MKFENRLILESEIEKYDFSKFESSLVHKTFVNKIKKWTVNQKADVFLVFLKGSIGYSPDYFGFFHDGVYFNISLFKKVWRDEKGRNCLEWELSEKMVCPHRESLLDLEQYEVKEVVCRAIPFIESALYVFGVCYSTENLENINVRIKTFEKQ